MLRRIIIAQMLSLFWVTAALSESIQTECIQTECIQIGADKFHDGDEVYIQFGGSHWWKAYSYVDGKTVVAGTTLPDDIFSVFILEIEDVDKRSFLLRNKAFDKYVTRFCCTSVVGGQTSTWVLELSEMTDERRPYAVLQPFNDGNSNSLDSNNNGLQTVGGTRLSRHCCLDNETGLNLIVSRTNDKEFSGAKVVRVVDYGKQPPPVKLKATEPPEFEDTKHRDMTIGKVRFDIHAEDATIRPVGFQHPTMKLTLSAEASSNGVSRYVILSLVGTRVAADANGDLHYPNHNEKGHVRGRRGWYLEQAVATIRSKDRRATLVSDGPPTTTQTGSVSYTSGVDVQTGASISKQGPEVGVSAGFSLSKSNTVNLSDYHIKNISRGNYLKVEYNLASLKGGEPYDNIQSFWPYSIEKQLFIVSLEDLPDKAMSQFPVEPIATFQVPMDLGDTATFGIELEILLKSVHFYLDDGIFGRVAWKSSRIDFKRDFKIDLSGLDD